MRTGAKNTKRGSKKSENWCEKKNYTRSQNSESKQT